MLYYVINYYPLLLCIISPALKITLYVDIDGISSNIKTKMVPNIIIYCLSEIHLADTV